MLADVKPLLMKHVGRSYAKATDGIATNCKG